MESSTIGMLFQGLWQNILTTAMSAVLPFIVGTIFTLIAGINKKASNVINWLSLPTESLFPGLVVLLVYYLGMPMFSKIGVTIPSSVFSSVFLAMALSICFIGYMPARYVPSFSRGKNILYNGLGLVSSLFKWTTLGSFIAVFDITKEAMRIGAINYEMVTPVVLALVITVVVVLIIEIAKRLVKQFMK